MYYGIAENKFIIASLISIKDVPFLTDMDNVPPRISCPPDVLTSSFAGATSYGVRWEEPKVSDNSGREVSVTPSIPMGSRFPIGVTEVIYTATDFSGNNATCSFTVTVRGGC